MNFGENPHAQRAARVCVGVGACRFIVTDSDVVDISVFEFPGKGTRAHDDIISAVGEIGKGAFENGGRWLEEAGLIAYSSTAT